MQALPVIARLIRGDAKEPGLKLALALEGFDILDDREKNFLANLLHIFPSEIASELKNKSPRGGIMPIEELVPGGGISPPATREQFGLGLLSHTVCKCIRRNDE